MNKILNGVKDQPWNSFTSILSTLTLVILCLSHTICLLWPQTYHLHLKHLSQNITWSLSCSFYLPRRKYKTSNTKAWRYQNLKDKNVNFKMRRLNVCTKEMLFPFIYNIKSLNISWVYSWPLKTNISHLLYIWLCPCFQLLTRRLKMEVSTSNDSNFSFPFSLSKSWNVNTISTTTVLDKGLRTIIYAKGMT